MAAAATTQVAVTEARPTLRFDMPINEAAAFMSSFALGDGSKPFAPFASYLDRLVGR